MSLGIHCKTYGHHKDLKQSHQGYILQLKAFDVILETD